MAATKVPMALQRLTAQNTASVLARTALRSRAAPLALNAVAHQIRTAQTASQMVSQADGLQILNNQRLHRPVSPNLGIYKWQTGSVLSSLHRMTGVAYSGLFYVFAIGVAAGPIVGMPITAAGLAAGFGALPLAAKVAFKFGLGYPVILHCINGVRMLVNDTGAGFVNKTSIFWGQVVAATSAVVTLGLCFI